MTAVMFRRRKLGRTSVREITRLSETGILNVRNDQPFPDNIDMVFRWGCTSNLPRGVKVINNAEAIHQVADKAGFRKTSADMGLAPETSLSFAEWRADYAGLKADKWVVRRATHHQGRFLDVFEKDQEEAMKAKCAEYGEGNYYISKFIPKVAEYRVFVAQGRAGWVANKTPADKDAVAWNVAQGGRFDNVRWGDWPLAVVLCAIKAFNLTKLDFGGVDVMVDADGKPYVLEINSAPSLTSPYRQATTAKIFDYIVRNGADRIPLGGHEGYRSLIHPALTDEALVGE